MLLFKADPVDARKWNRETMTGVVEDFIENRVAPLVYAKSIEQP